MALNSLGQISMGGSTAGESIALELGLGPTSSISLGTPAVYALAGKGSANDVDMGSFRGRSSAYKFTISGERVNLYNAAIASGWNGSGKVVVTLSNSVYSLSTGSPALYIAGFPAGVEVNTNGYYIIGAGGTGGIGGDAFYRPYQLAPLSYQFGPAGVGGTGGTALAIASNNTGVVSIINDKSIIAGGGGGGGGGGGVREVTNPRGGGTTFYTPGGGGGGGGGGGMGARPGYGQANGATLGGYYGSLNTTGAYATYGSGGGQPEGGAGGTGALAVAYNNTLANPTCYGGNGGQGGGWGTAGGDGPKGYGVCAPQFGTTNGAAGGAAGLAVSGYNYAIFSGPGSILGGVA